jgi:hypothetical protein
MVTTQSLGKRMTLIRYLSAATVLMFATTANAAVITLDSIDNGWVTSDNIHSTINLNIITGDYTGGTNSFFRFDVSPLSGRTVSAVDVTFRANGRYGGDGSTTIDFFDASNSNPPTHVDLESGNQYGSAIYAGTFDSAMDLFTVSFNSFAFSDVVTSGLFTFGATLGAGETGFIWNRSSVTDPGAASITVIYGDSQAVSEPSTIALFGLGLPGLGFALGRRQS